MHGYKRVNWKTFQNYAKQLQYLDCLHVYTWFRHKGMKVTFHVVKVIDLLLLTPPSEARRGYTKS